jgi:hypothetical protein
VGRIVNGGKLGCGTLFFVRQSLSILGLSQFLLQPVEKIGPTRGWIQGCKKDGQQGVTKDFVH